MRCPPNRPSVRLASWSGFRCWSLCRDIWHEQSRPPCQHDGTADQEDRQNLLYTDTAHIR